jgi:hypothetical protein
MGVVRPPTTVTRIEKKWRDFLWAGSEQANGSKSLVSWSVVCSQRHTGGLGVKNIVIKNSCLLLKMLHILFTLMT